MINKVDILAFGAHPDDVELGCSGTLAKLIAEGKKVAVVDLTQGEMGTRGTAETRRQESEKSTKILGISTRENLKMRDGFLSNSEEYQMRIVEMIRKYQPEIVFCNALEDRHPDHGKASKLVSDACFLSGLRKVQTTLNGEVQLPWRPKQVFHYIQWRELTPDFVVDISGFLEKKMECCKAFHTQFFNPESKEPTTPIATRNFLDSIEYRARNLGRLANVEAAEGFNTEKTLALKNFSGIVC